MPCDKNDERNETAADGVRRKHVHPEQELAGLSSDSSHHAITAIGQSHVLAGYYVKVFAILSCFRVGGGSPSVNRQQESPPSRTIGSGD